MPGFRCWTLMLLLALTLAGCDSRAPRLVSGDAAPEFALTDLSGQTVRLADLRGQVVAVRFWADWCPFCKGEMQELEPVYRQRQAEGLRLLAVNVGQDRETAHRFVARLGISYDTLLDPESATARQYGVIGLPTTFFIDRQGRLRGKILGESDAATFERMVAPLLKGD